MVTSKKALLITLTVLIGQTALIQATALKTVGVRATQAAQILGTSPQAIKAAGLVRRGGWIDMSAARARFSPTNPMQSITPMTRSNQTDLLALSQHETIIIDAEAQYATTTDFFAGLAQISRNVLTSIKKSAQQVGIKATQYLQNKPVQTFGSLFAALGLGSGYLANNRQQELQAANTQASQEITAEAKWLLEKKEATEVVPKTATSWLSGWFR